MKTLVTYHSDTGNTEKLAKAISEGITGTEKTLAAVTEVQHADRYDVYFVGFPVQGGSVPREVEQFIKTIPADKKVAFFATHGSLRGGQLAITAFYHAITLASQTKITGTFGCRGQVKPDIIESMMGNAAHRGWALEAQSATGHPDEADLEDAVEFARMMMTKASQV